MPKSKLAARHEGRGSTAADGAASPCRRWDIAAADTASLLALRLQQQERKQTLLRRPITSNADGGSAGGGGLGGGAADGNGDVDVGRPKFVFRVGQTNGAESDVQDEAGAGCGLAALLVAVRRHVCRDTATCMPPYGRHMAAMHAAHSNVTANDDVRTKFGQKQLLGRDPLVSHPACWSRQQTAQPHSPPSMAP
eukprot:365650-Chlamydomonas_euryale.AAC.15